MTSAIQQLEARWLLSGYNFNSMADFPDNNLTAPSAIAVDSAGDVFGIALPAGGGNGDVYEISANTTTPQILATFDGANGTGPNSIALDPTTGALYGTTTTGGANSVGVVWEFPSGGNTIEPLASFTTAQV